MDVDSVESMQLVSTSGYSLELVPRIDDSNTQFSDLSPMERLSIEHFFLRTRTIRIRWSQIMQRVSTYFQIY